MDVSIIQINWAGDPVDFSGSKHILPITKYIGSNSQMSIYIMFSMN